MPQEHERMNRRDFTRAAAVAAGVLGARQLSAAEKPEAGPKIGLYSITYLAVWYRGDALTLEQVIDRAKKFGYDGVEVDGKRPHGDPLDMPDEEKIFWARTQPNRIAVGSHHGTVGRLSEGQRKPSGYLREKRPGEWQGQRGVVSMQNPEMARRQRLIRISETEPAVPFKSTFDVGGLHTLRQSLPAQLPPRRIPSEPVMCQADGYQPV